ncbi:unnamed protein product, partial [Brachionus calyciflorus]
SSVFAIRILYETIKDIKKIDNAHDIIEKYVASLDAYDYTVHAHLHLADQVKKHGPLYSHSQFVFEGAIYNLKNKMHGTKGYLNQLINQIDNQMTFNSMLKPENFKSQQFYSYSYKNSNNFKLENFDIDQLLHPFTKKILNLNDQKIFNSFFGNEKDSLNVVCAYRLYFEKRLYHSMQFSRKRNSNSYTVSIEIDGKELNETT